MQITGIIFVAIVGLLIAFSAISSSDDTESQNTNIPIHKMGELIVHQETSDDSITIKVNEATIVIDEKTPQTCFAGYCTDDRKPGKYIIRVNFEITNLSTDVYVHSKMNMKIEEKDGKRFGPASRSLGLSISELGKGKSLTDSIVYDVDVPLSEYLFVVEPMAFLGGQETKIALNEIQKIRPKLCQGQADCFAGIITKIVDGDTLDVQNIETDEVIRIRLALADTPEKGENQYDTAKEFTSGFCPVSSYILFDEDDGQTEGSFERKIGKVFCESKLLNDTLLLHELAIIDTRFCEKSEYGIEQWAIDYGCPS